MYTISKEFQFSYSHRVWNQELSDSQECKCRHLHGHNGVLTIELSSNTLTRDMVLDYNELNHIKAFVDSFIDHRLIMDKNDPMLKFLISPYAVMESKYGFNKIKKQGFNKIKKQGVYLCDEEQELYESIVLIECCPSSENFCRILYKELKKDCSFISWVSWSETPKTNASYWE